MPSPPEYPIRPHPKGGAADPGLVLPGGTAAAQPTQAPQTFETQQVSQLSQRQQQQRTMIEIAQRAGALKAARAFHDGYKDVKAVGEICAAIRRTFAREKEQL